MKNNNKPMKTLYIILSLSLLFTAVLFTKVYVDNMSDNKPDKHKTEIENKVEIKNLEIKIPEETNDKEEPDNNEIKTTYSTYYTTTSLNIRTGASIDSGIYTTVVTNTKLEVADNFNMNGWKMIKYDNKDLYVNGKYLSEKPIEIKKDKPQNTNRSSNNLIGNFRITHYAGDTATSTGARPTVGRTIAVDPKVIPYGSKVIINGHTYIAEDCGGAIKGNKIDIFVGSESEAYQKGVYHTNVYWG